MSWTKKQKKERCENCNGSGKCPDCLGEGCYACEDKGKCAYCKGKGSIKVDYWVEK